MERIVVKVGTSSLINKEGRLDKEPIKKIAGQIAQLQEDGVEVAVVTSGAIASGRIVLGANNGNEVRKQVLAAVGQRPLINAWGEAFDQYHLNMGLFLFSEADLDKPRLPLRDALGVGIVPLINANDTVSVDEIRKLAISADNDRLAFFIGSFLVDASKLVFLTEAAGVLDSEGKVINSLSCLEDLERVALFSKTTLGTGGMDSKLLEARRFITNGNKVAYIAGVGLDDVILRAARGETIGTRVTLPLQGYFNI